jgi:hypothetical protein
MRTEVIIALMLSLSALISGFLTLIAGKNYQLEFRFYGTRLNPVRKFAALPLDDV